MTIKTVGGVVGRFHVPKHTEGHMAVIQAALQESDRVIFFLGRTGGQGTDLNPVPFDLRKRLIQKVFHDDIDRLKVIPLLDRGDPVPWSRDLDTLIEKEVSQDEAVTLYAGRDGFLERYKGHHQTKKVDTVFSESGTEVRANLSWGDVPCLESAIMSTIILTNERYPIAYQTIDLALLSPDNKYIFLGRKPNEEKFRFLGGFVDPGESKEEAVIREGHEEAGDIKISKPLYVGSSAIDDFRYRGSKDGITTALFRGYHLGGEVVGRDDIEEIKRFRLTDDAILPNLMLIHLGLYVELRNHLQAQGISFTA